MKLAVVIPIYNRPAYVEQCLNSLTRATFPEGTIIYLIDDCSASQARRMAKEYKHPSTTVIYHRTDVNRGVCNALIVGIGMAIQDGCDLFMNLDSDAIVKPDFVSKTISLHDKFHGQIITGFNCLTKNNNGTERHPVIETGEGWNRKRSVGGLNMCFDFATYESHIFPALQKGARRLCNWDAEACKSSGGAYCVVPSVVQHIGFSSSMGHSVSEPPDVAEDFEDGKESKVVESDHVKPGRLHLPSVTLLTVNCDKIETGIAAMEASLKDIDFGAVKFLTSQQTDYRHAVKIPHIGSIQEYSRFMVKELDKYVDTDYVLIIQSDGYVKNAAGWRPEFLNYDYIGATWWYGDDYNVGNGGFSLRSKRLLSILATDRYIINTHPEDHHICRTYGRHLKRRHGIKFAPDNIAKKFSIEGYRQRDKTYIGQFGFHGGAVVFPGESKPLVVMELQQPNKPDIVVINQPFGLGDFLFCIPLARDYMKEGMKVVWPVVSAYANIGKHFPDIVFIDKNNLKVDYERKDEYVQHGMKVIPLRWSYDIQRVPFRDCMKSKYGMFGKDWHRWRESTWLRDTAREDELFYKVLGLSDGARYNLVNTMFRSDKSGAARVNVANGLLNVQLREVAGFTLLDWGKVIENATTIHTVSTSINYMIELMELKAEEIHLYCRKPDETHFKNIDYLLTKKYHFHY